MGGLGSIPGVGRPPGEGHGNPLQYSLAWRIPWTEEPDSYSPRGRKESDMTEQLTHTHARTHTQMFHGRPQCHCLQFSLWTNVSNQNKLLENLYQDILGFIFQAPNCASGIRQLTGRCMTDPDLLLRICGREKPERLGREGGRFLPAPLRLFHFGIVKHMIGLLSG